MLRLAVHFIMSPKRDAVRPQDIHGTTPLMQFDLMLHSRCHWYQHCSPKQQHARKWMKLTSCAS